MPPPEFAIFFPGGPDRWGAVSRYGVSRHRAGTCYPLRKRGRTGPFLAEYGAPAPVPRRGNYLLTRKTQPLRNALARLAARYPVREVGDGRAG